jgi:hypothetical protein
VSVLREVFSRVLALGQLTQEEIVREMNEALRRTEEARIYHWVAKTGKYPPRRSLSRESPVTVAKVVERSTPPGLSQVA